MTLFQESSKLKANVPFLLENAKIDAANLLKSHTEAFW